MQTIKYMDIADRGGASPNGASAPTDNVKDPEDLTTNEVRQGETGHGVRYVLMVSLTAALIGLAVAWVYVY